jgi:hypothetical protein
MDNLDNVFPITFEASNGRVGILPDGLRARYSDDTSHQLFATQLADELGFIEGAFSYMSPTFDNLDFIGGVRYVFLDAHLQLTPGPTSDDQLTWSDPLIGVR